MMLEKRPFESLRKMADEKTTRSTGSTTTHITKFYARLCQKKTRAYQPSFAPPDVMYNNHKLTTTGIKKDQFYAPL